MEQTRIVRTLKSCSNIYQYCQTTSEVWNLTLHYNQYEYQMELPNSIFLITMNLWNLENSSKDDLWFRRSCTGHNGVCAHDPLVVDTFWDIGVMVLTSLSMLRHMVYLRRGGKYAVDPKGMKSQFRGHHITASQSVSGASIATSTSRYFFSVFVFFAINDIYSYELILFTVW